MAEIVVSLANPRRPPFHPDLIPGFTLLLLMMMMVMMARVTFP